MDGRERRCGLSGRDSESYWRDVRQPEYRRSGQSHVPAISACVSCVVEGAFCAQAVPIAVAVPAFLAAQRHHGPFCHRAPRGSSHLEKEDSEAAIRDLGVCSFPKGFSIQGGLTCSSVVVRCTALPAVDSTDDRLPAAWLAWRHPIAAVGKARERETCEAGVVANCDQAQSTGCK